MRPSDPAPSERVGKLPVRLPDFPALLREVETSAAGRLRLLFSVVLGALLLLGAGDDAARVDRLGHQLMCVCGCNQILLECNHVGCSYSTRMRDELIAAVGRGETDNGVLQWFIQNYGTAVLSAPSKTGFSLLAWIMPYFALVFGIVLVAFAVRAWRNRPLPVPANASGPLRGEELERFRDQVRRETRL